MSRETMPAWLVRAAAWLTPRRIRAHAIILAVCLWGVCAIDYATPGLFDRAGNIKFQDFLSFYISGKLIAQGRTTDLYNEGERGAEMNAIVGSSDVTQNASRQTWFHPTAGSPLNVRIPNLYGPQVALIFVPLARISFLIAAEVWVALNLLIYFACVYAIWRGCPNLVAHAQIMALAAIAFPPLFHFFVRGQTSVLVLTCFTAALLALQTNRLWLAGAAFGLLAFKPQFLVAIPLILLLARAWKILGGLILSAAAQLAFTRIYFGPAVLNSYLEMLSHSSRWIDVAELQLAPIQMHSLRAFWTLLIPSPNVALALYIFSSLSVIAISAAIWKSQLPLALRFSALTFAAVLVNPHLFIYDLLVLAPALLLATDWTLANATHAAIPLRPLLYLAFVLPLFGPLAQWTHTQLSVLVFVAILWFLYHMETRGHKLATSESAVV
jgi:alpha-1,2-mannosyltransferase